MPRRAQAEDEAEDVEEVEFDWVATHTQLKKAAPMLGKVLAEFEMLGSKSVSITVQREDGPQEFDFNMAQYALLQEQFASRMNLLKLHRVKARPGATQALTPVFLGAELMSLLTDQKLIDAGAFNIVEKNKDGEVTKEWCPFKVKGNPLAPLKERGLAFAPTVANLLRAYGNNRGLVALATYNQNINARLTKKKTPEDKIEAQYNHAYVGLDPAAKAHLKPLIGRLGRYYKSKAASAETKPKKKKATKAKTVKQTVPATEVAKKEGFDPDQFQFNAMIQSFIKAGKLSPADDKDAKYSAGKLSAEQAALLAEIKAQKAKNETYRALLAQDEATMTSEKLENRRKKQEAAEKAAAKKGAEEEEEAEAEEGEDE